MALVIMIHYYHCILHFPLALQMCGMLQQQTEQNYSNLGNLSILWIRFQCKINSHPWQKWYQFLTTKLLKKNIHRHMASGHNNTSFYFLHSGYKLQLQTTIFRQSIILCVARYILQCSAGIPRPYTEVS